MEYTQKDRPLRVETVLGEDVLLLEGFQGTESLSDPFAFTLDLLSTERAIAGGDILGTPVAVTVRLPEGRERTVHGRVSRFGRLGRREDLTEYRAEVVPWLWFLSLTRDSRIFQQKSVLEIIETVFSDLGWSDFEIRCTRSYPPREFCVQYRESHLDFVSRLMEEEGIFYFFEHESAKHTLVLADDNSTFEPVEGGTFRLAPRGAPLREGEDVVRSFVRQEAVNPNKVSLRDYDYLQPSFTLEATLEGSPSAPEAGALEIYDYPGSYLTKEEGERYARLRLEAREALNQVCRGEGTVRAFRSGGTFELRDEARSPLDGSYLLTSVAHDARGGGYRSSGDFEYRTSFRCIPAAVPFRPERATPRPRVHGTQTAVVVGKAGEEIWTDSHGRIKVQFHWDRLGGKDENSSCWVRVATPWAGKQWGMLHIPRIGQEVVVDFLEGDPDQPIVVGSVYNAEQPTPYDLPANQTRSGLRSRSSKGGSGANFNEIRFEDAKGSEVMYLHAEKDQEIVVENNRSDTVGNDESASVGNDQEIAVGNERSVSIGADDALTVGGNRDVTVSEDLSVTVSGGRSTGVTGDDVLDVGGDREASVGQDEATSVGTDRTVSVGKNDQLSVGRSLTIEAGNEITLRTGKASISMKKDGTIEISGKDITISGSGKMDVKASGKLAMKGSQVTMN